MKNILEKDTMPILLKYQNSVTLPTLFLISSSFAHWSDTGAEVAVEAGMGEGRTDIREAPELDTIFPTMFSYFSMNRGSIGGLGPGESGSLFQLRLKDRNGIKTTYVYCTNFGHTF